MAAPTTERKQSKEKGIDPRLVQEIAAEMGETADLAQMLIKRILRNLGEERTRDLVQQAKAVEEQGGMLVPDGSRRRTLGGIFFKLTKDAATPEERARIWMPKNRRPKAKNATPETAEATAAP